MNITQAQLIIRNSRNRGTLQYYDAVRKLDEEVGQIQAIADAAEAFRAKPPDDMEDRIPFQQYTTAGDCRKLLNAYAAAEAAREK